MSTPPPPETAASVLRRLAPTALIPALVFEIGNGALAPIIALVAIAEGASPAAAGLMLSLGGIGRILGDVPAGLLADRVGDRRAMLGATIVTTAALALSWTVPAIWALALGQLLIGFSTAIFYLARQTYVSHVVAIDLRARALSTLGGSHRIGLFIGPFAGALAIHAWGTRAAFGVALAATLATAALLLAVPDDSPPDAVGAGDGIRGVIALLKDQRLLFATLGTGVLLVGAVRAARQTVLPLWANHIGLSAAATSIVFGIANAVDMSLFYPAGHAMDRRGRLAVAVPSMVLLGAGMMILPLSHAEWTLGAAAVVMSVGNGIGSGIMMTIGADVAPPRERAAFLSLWRVLSDSGNALGPLVPAAVTVVATLGLGISVTGLLGLAAAAGLARWVPRYSPYATAAMAREHRRRLAESA